MARTREGEKQEIDVSRVPKQRPGHRQGNRWGGQKTSRYLSSLGTVATAPSTHPTHTTQQHAKHTPRNPPESSPFAAQPENNTSAETIICIYRWRVARQTPGSWQRPEQGRFAHNIHYDTFPGQSVAVLRPPPPDTGPPDTPTPMPAAAAGGRVRVIGRASRRWCRRWCRCRVSFVRCRLVISPG